MNLILTTTIKRRRCHSSKQYIDIVCTTGPAESDSTTDYYVFVMQNMPKNALGQATQRFSHIADPVDMQDYPPYKTEDLPYFRSNQITLRVRSQFQAQHIIEQMRKDIDRLVKACQAVPYDDETFSEQFSS